MLTVLSETIHLEEQSTIIVKYNERERCISDYLRKLMIHVVSNKLERTQTPSSIYFGGARIRELISFFSLYIYIYNMYHV